MAVKVNVPESAKIRLYLSFLISYKNLNYKKLRTFLTAGGISIGVTAVFVLSEKC